MFGKKTKRKQKITSKTMELLGENKKNSKQQQKKILKKTRILTCVYNISGEYTLKGFARIRK